MSSNHLILCLSLLLLLSIFSNIRVFSSESVLRNRSPKYWSFSFSISPSNEYSRSPCSLRDSQESSPTPQFKSINSLVLSSLYSPTLTSIHDYWYGLLLAIPVVKSLCFLTYYLGWENPLQKEMTTHSSTLAWKVPWEPGGLQSMVSQRVRYN